MNCQRCKKPLKRGYYYNGTAYGPECIQKVAGRKVKLHKLKIYQPAPGEDDDEKRQTELDFE